MGTLPFKKCGVRCHSALKREGISHNVSLLCLLIAGIAIRFSFLFQPICQDESITYLYFANHPLSIIVSNYTDPNHHILHTILVHLSTTFFGNDVWAIRLPAFIAGVLILPATYLVMRRLFNKKVALLAVALVVPSSLLIEYSTNGRGYSLQALLFLVLIMIAFHVIRTNSNGAWAGFIIVSALGFYTVPTMLYFFGALVIWILLSALYRDSPVKRSSLAIKTALATVLSMTLVVLLYLAPAINSGVSSLVSNKWVKSLPFSSFFRGVPGNIRSCWEAWKGGLPLIVAILLAAGFLMALIFYRRMAGYRVNLVVVILAWCTLLLLIQRVLPPARVWLPILPLFLGYAAAGLYYSGHLASDWLSKRWSRGPVFGSAFLPVLFLFISLWMCVLVVINQSPYQPADQITFRDAEEAVTWLQERLEPGDLVYADPRMARHLEYYFLRNDVLFSHLFRYPHDMDKQYDNINRVFVIDANREGFPLSSSLEHSNLNLKRTPEGRTVVVFPFSSIVEIDDPVLERN